ncbi:MAG: hydrolase [Clostridia bacterium]|jgi:hypothetical protein|nr:hydrolase [Clostridia bacterium]MCI2014071.1 hydrolase [Clostridia bacterium]
MDISLTIENPQKNKVYEPVVEEGIKWTTGREGTPGQLEFSVIKDNIIDFQEGNRVEFRVDGKPVFLGFVFKKSRSKDGLISVTAYDQLRYFKNKDTYQYENKTASWLLKRIAKDFSLFTGDVDDTGYIIASRVEDNTTLFDMMKNALEVTMQNTKKMYVLYDDFGKLALKNIGNMKVPVKIEEQTAQDFNYETSIDSQTYNKVKLLYQDSSTHEMKIFPKQCDESIKRWGVLQYFDKINDISNGQNVADMILELYNNKTRSISVSGVFGDLRVRAGSQVPVFLNFGDILTNNWLIVEKCTHTFKQSEHTMDLELSGGEYLA